MQLIEIRSIALHCEGELKLDITYIDGLNV
jgi:hypothetical protein